MVDESGLSDESAGLSKQYGIPRTLPVADSFRQADCDASVMEIVSIEGENAIYRGVCMMQHQYTQKILLSSLQNKQFVEEEDFRVNEDGKLQIGDGEGFAAEELESF